MILSRSQWRQLIGKKVGFRDKAYGKYEVGVVRKVEFFMGVKIQFDGGVSTWYYPSVLDVEAIAKEKVD